MSSSENKEYVYELDNFKVDQEGNLYSVEPLKNGEGISTELIANHAPLLHRNVRIQDGFTTVEQIEFQALRDYKREPPVMTDKKAIRGATPDVIFSPACFIYPGRGHVSQYSLFMLKQCAKDNKVENLYTHTGWMVTEDGERVYLNGENSICKSGLTDKYAVQLLPDFRRLRFYNVPDNSHMSLETVVEGMARAVPDWVHIPLYAYVFLTPLNDMLRQKGKAFGVLGQSLLNTVRTRERSKRHMKILVINCGSSSLKYQLFDMEDESVSAKGLVDRIGIDGSNLVHRKFLP